MCGKKSQKLMGQDNKQTLEARPTAHLVSLKGRTYVSERGSLWFNEVHELSRGSTALSSADIPAN